ncbi:MAG: hypothetical protein Q9M11_03845 [Mariprofundaceae bacterium]|nr:hypothetical protein [Mariprofundaceae bacterium]
MNINKKWNVIFDYGGVISNGSRKDIIIDALCNNENQRNIMNDFFLSKFVKEAARGKHSKLEINKRIKLLLKGVNEARINQVFIESCKPNGEVLLILNKLLGNSNLYIVSDSLPHFSDYIENNFYSMFNESYFSDRLGTRKSEMLFDIIKEKKSNIFKKSVYIDDKELNFKSPVLSNVLTIKYKSAAQLNKKLVEIGILKS